MRTRDPDKAVIKSPLQFVLAGGVLVLTIVSLADVVHRKGEAVDAKLAPRRGDKDRKLGRVRR